MIKKRLLGVLLAAIAMFVWGFAYWAGLGAIVRPFKNLSAEQETAVIEALTATETKTDVYYIPGIPPAADTAANDAWMQQHQEGPLAGIIFINEGKDPMAAGMMIQGFLHMLLTAFGPAVCLCFASSRLPTYGKRVLFSGFLGLLASF